MADLVKGTLADAVSLLSKPPFLRRGNSHPDVVPQPASGAGWTRAVPNDWWRRPVAVTFLFTASATAAMRTLFYNVLDADSNLISQTQLTPPLTAGIAWQVSADLSGTADFSGGASFNAMGQQTSPTAGTTICSAALIGGVYVVSWRVAVGGTTGGSEVNNFGLYLGSTLLLQSEQTSSAGTDIQQNPVTVIVPAAGATLAVKAIANGTSGAIYKAQFTAAPDSGLSSYPQLPDLVLKPGWQEQIAVTGVQAGDQISQLITLGERYPSDWADGTLEHDVESLLRELLQRRGAGV